MADYYQNKKYGNVEHIEDGYTYLYGENNEMPKITWSLFYPDSYIRNEERQTNKLNGPDLYNSWMKFHNIVVESTRHQVEIISKYISYIGHRELEEICSYYTGKRAMIDSIQKIIDDYNKNPAYYFSKEKFVVDKYDYDNQLFFDQTKDKYLCMFYKIQFYKLMLKMIENIKEQETSLLNKIVNNKEELENKNNKSRLSYEKKEEQKKLNNIIENKNNWRHTIRFSDDIRRFQIEINTLDEQLKKIMKKDTETKGGKKRKTKKSKSIMKKRKTKRRTKRRYK